MSAGDMSYPLFSETGSSFVDLLRRVAPDALPPAALTPGSAGQAFDITHGTTVVAIRFADGVVMAGDRRATAGYTIANRRIEKVFPADDLSGVAIAGAAGPAVEMVRLFQVQLQHYEKVEGEQLSLEGKANQLAQMVRANLPAAMQGFVVVPLFAGYDNRRQQGRVFSFDAAGGKYEEADYQANGSGGVHARNWIKAAWQEGLTADATIEIAIRALFAAADEDVATGGPDLVRGIYPTVATIDADGFQALSDDDVATRAQALLGGAARGGNETQGPPRGNGGERDR
jgi:proteasome beta subunit